MSEIKNKNKIYIVLASMIVIVGIVLFIMIGNKEEVYSDDSNNYIYINKMNDLGSTFEEIDEKCSESFTAFGENPIDETVRTNLANDLLSLIEYYEGYTQITVTTRYEKLHNSLVEASEQLVEINTTFAEGIGDLEFNLVSDEGAELIKEYTENLKVAEEEFNQCFNELFNALQ